MKFDLELPTKTSANTCDLSSLDQNYGPDATEGALESSWKVVKEESGAWKVVKISSEDKI